ncbi:hypothetical protein F4782DRAFT_240614 [Xylaria castorea]|nr:hypothetical protein F4782DRAFT_240614 [Xylaria castorea]
MCYYINFRDIKSVIYLARKTTGDENQYINSPFDGRAHPLSHKMLGSLLAAASTCLSTLMGQRQSSTKPTPSTSGTSGSTAFPPRPPPPTHEPVRPSFPQFTSLPLEIREMIWKFALPGPRELRVLRGFSDIKWNVFMNRVNFFAPLSQVCFESRRVMLEAGYRLAHAGNTSLPDIGVWFCEERGDTVFIEIIPDMVCFMRA